MRRFGHFLPSWLAALLMISMSLAHAQSARPDSPDVADDGVEAEVPEVVVESTDDAEVDSRAREALAEYVDGLVRTQQREHGLGALTVSIVRDDDLWLARGYGLADIDAARSVEPESTLFRIGSVSKTFTWTAVMMLAERDQLDLDTDVNEYLEAVAVEEAFGEPVTLRHLMHHRAGFEDTLRLFAVADDDPRSLSELLAEHQPERVYPPGKRTSYSNWGSALAAQIVEDVAGVAYGEFLREEILEPLGMHETTWLAPATMDEDLRQRLATGYKPEKGALGLQGYMQIGPYWPAGGIASTATDMARWMSFHLNGGELDGVRLLDAGTHERMWTRAFDDRPDAADVAHGFQDRTYRGMRTLGHGGGTAAFLTNMVLVPELGLGVFLSQNTAHTGSPISQLPDLVIDRIAGHAYRPLQVAEGDTESLADLAGTYLNNRRVFSTFTALFGLQGVTTLTPMSEDAFMLSGMDQARYYRRVSSLSDAFESPGGERVALIRDDGGKVSALADGSGVHTLERVSGLEAPRTLFIALAVALLLALTTVLGAWWRFGRDRLVTIGSRVAGGVALLGAGSMLVLVVAVAMLIAGFAEFDISRMSEIYPSAGMFYTHYAAWGVAVSAALMVLAHWPAWTAPDWGWWRRLHFGLFTLALLFLTVLLWQWRVIGAPVL